MFDAGGGAGGIPEIPGEPDGLRAGAAGLSAAAGQLGGLAGEVAGATGGIPWSGVAAGLARVAVAAAAVPLRDADEGLTVAAAALRRFAGELEAAQRESDRARVALGDALAAASSAALAIGELSAAEDVDDAAVARMGDRLSAANADAAAARTAGAQAYERAEQAARSAAATFSAVAGAAPEPPPPPPPPPPPEDDGGFWGGVGDAFKGAGGAIVDGASAVGGAVSSGWNAAGEIGSPWDPRSPAFMVDAVEGAAGAVWGVGELAWQGVQATPQYERFDPEGAAEARQGFADGARYAWEHPWETTKQVLGIHHFENGEPGKFTGEAGITALAALASGGTAVAARGVSGASRAARVGDDVADAGRAARAADNLDDVRGVGRVDYSSRMAREVDNFAEPKPAPVTASRTTDEWLVNVGDSSRAVGDGRSIGWWVPLDEARGYTSIENIRDRAALPEQWFEGGPHQAKDEVLIARIPAGEETTRLSGRAAPQPDVPDPRPGGGRQIFFKEFDAAWIEGRVGTDDFLAGREPELPGKPPR